MLSVHAFDGNGMMIDADVVDGSDVERVLSGFLKNPNANDLHLYNAKPGCFAARVDRA